MVKLTPKISVVSKIFGGPYPSMAMVMLALIITSCYDFGKDVSNTIGPFATPTWSNDIMPLFAENCFPCHISESQAGLNLSTYANATAQTRIINPGQPDSSVLVERIEGTLQPRMPLGGPYLSSEQINKISEWIADGAPDN